MRTSPTHSKLPALFGLLLLAAGLGACNKDDKPDRQYCDSSGCFACKGDNCYPVPGTPVPPDPGTVTSCDNDPACGAGRVCNLGRCESACTEDANCKSGNSCLSGRCRPTGSAQCGVAGALCTEAAACGAGRTCVGNACAKLCNDGKCAVGQVCKDGACIEDPAPQVAQCQFDYDCDTGKGAFRCVNAYCLSKCSESATCGEGAACVKGLCRADRRPS